MDAVCTDLRAKSGWGDDYPQADYNFMVRLAELTGTTISRWNNGDPGLHSPMSSAPRARMRATTASI
jgi:hypothetical protein